MVLLWAHRLWARPGTSLVCFPAEVLKMPLLAWGSWVGSINCGLLHGGGYMQ